MSFGLNNAIDFSILMQQIASFIHTRKHKKIHKQSMGRRNGSERRNLVIVDVACLLVQPIRHGFEEDGDRRDLLRVRLQQREKGGNFEMRSKRAHAFWARIRRIQNQKQTMDRILCGDDEEMETRPDSRARNGLHAAHPTP
jgi:hypothetical protein